MATSAANRALHHELSGPLRHGVRGLMWALSAAWLLYLVTAGLGDASVIRDAVIGIVSIGCAVSVLLRVVLVREHRKVWAPLAAGVVAYTAGALVWALWLEPLADPPFPSIADVLNLALYPLSYGTIVLVVRARIGRLSASLWLDALIGTLSVTAVGAALLLGPIVAGVSGSFAAVAVSVAYPLGDVLLAASVVGGLVLTGFRLDRASLLVAGGFALFTAADLVYLSAIAEASYVTASLENLLWGAGLLLLQRSAWTRLAPVAGGRARLAAPVPSGFALAGLAVLVLDHFERVHELALGMAAATIVAALVRLLHTVREERGMWETRRQALTDELTGLPNRRALSDALARVLHGGGASHVGLLVIDLNGFKELNDTLGHEAGDEVLRAVGERLADALRAGDLLVRLGGDEFAVVLDRCGPDGAEAEVVAAKLLRALEPSFPVMGISVQIGASVGVACSPDHGRTASELLKRADVAMYRAKAARTGIERYDGARDGRSAERLALAGQLGQALVAGEIVAHYQPQVQPADGRVVGVEALARWEHPQLGLLGPGRFLPAIEQSSLSRLLTLTVVEQAVAHAAGWRRDGLDLPVSVNLSAANLVDDAFDADVAEVLERHRLPADRLQLEITENIFLTDPERALTLLHRLRAMGIGLSLDDFGTRHSSLSHLDRLPVGELKIDRSFVAELATQRTSIIVASTIDLARRLGLHCVAEGIEDVTTWSTLSAMGCPAIQGYFVARPMPEPQLRDWLRGRPATRVATGGTPAAGPGGDAPVARPSAA